MTSTVPTSAAGRSDTIVNADQLMHALLAADSSAERVADSVIARAARAQVLYDSLRAALTPPAYARDTAFAASVLGEERALGGGACRRDASTATTGDELPIVDSELAACVEAVLRRERSVVTHADSVRDSVRLVVRERFRRGARAMVDAALAEQHPGRGGVTDEMREIGYDPGPNGRFPGTFDAFRNVYQLPSSLPSGALPGRP